MKRIINFTLEKWEMNSMLQMVRVTCREVTKTELKVLLEFIIYILSNNYLYYDGVAV